MTDYHIHVLPGIDDGPSTPAEAAEMLKSCKVRGVTRLIVTPHFIPHRQNAEAFLAARQEALESTEIPQGMEIRLGAEVYIEQRFCEDTDLRKLTMADSGYILLEPPYTPFKSWIENEIYNVIYGLKLTPIIAHIDRYLSWYAKDEVARLLNIKEAALQINADGLKDRSVIKLISSLLQQGRTILLGSDAHNLTTRPPTLDKAYKTLRDKLLPAEYKKISEANAGFL